LVIVRACLFVVGLSSLAACGTEPAPLPAPPPPLGASAPASLAAPSSEEEIATGSTVQIVDIGADDLFAANKKELIGKVCTVRGFGLSGDEGLFEGKLRCGYDPEYFFTQVSVGVLTARDVLPKEWPAHFEGEEVLPGKKVKLVGFSPDDQLFPWPKELTTRADTLLRKHGDLRGQVCEVLAEPPLASLLGVEEKAARPASQATSAPASASAPASTPSAASAPASRPALSKEPRGLVSTGEGWFGGAVRCGDQKLYLYQAAVEVL
jgi:hypothetical protein